MYVKNNKITEPLFTSRVYPPNLGTKYAILSGIKFMYTDVSSVSENQFTDNKILKIKKMIEPNNAPLMIISINVV